MGVWDNYSGVLYIGIAVVVSLDFISIQELGCWISEVIDDFAKTVSETVGNSIKKRHDPDASKSSLF